MMRMGIAAALAVTMLAPGAPAQAQSIVATPDAASAAFGQCLIMKTTGADRLLIARWLSGAMGAGAATRDLVTVDSAAKIETDRAMAALFTRLFAQDCAAALAPLQRSQNQLGVQAAGGKLGEMAMRELMSDPKVADAMFAYLKYVDYSRFAPPAE